jgi:thiamine-phosphate pyrophosphorylase
VIFLELREKHYSARGLYYLAVAFHEVTSRAGVLLIVNDHLDIALAAGADGVHLGQDDLPVPEARRLAPDLLIGASTHSLEEALHAQKEGADYINIGPIFAAKTKEGAAHFLDPEAIAQISRGIRVPFTVMGGINASNIDQVLAQGADRVAMVTAITQATEIAERVRMLREKITAFHKNADVRMRIGEYM